MSNRIAKRASIVRLPPKSNAEILLSRSAQVAVVFMGVVALVFALQAAEYILAPVGTALVVGLMLGPLATRLERHGLGTFASSTVVMIVFLAAIGLIALAVAAPLTFWMERLPQLWSELRLKLHDLKGPLDSIGNLRDQIRSITGAEGIKVAVDDASAMQNVAVLAPALLGQVLLFLVSLYFFIATRYDIRTAVLKTCFNRRLRWRVAHIFRDVEQFVSDYLLSITIINIGLAVAVGATLFVMGVPSALLWGALAGLLNIIVYIGPAIMVAILLAVGLAEYDSLWGSVLPALIYLLFNFVESQFVTPLVIGRRMTLNPFIVLLALAFWLWLWGPIGGFIAVPALLIVYAILRNIVPGADWIGDAARPVRKAPDANR